MGGELVIPIAMVVGGVAVVVLALRWALRETRGGARAQQKLDDLAQISRRESNAQDQLTKPKDALDRLRRRWDRRVRRAERVRDKRDPGR